MFSRLDLSPSRPIMNTDATHARLGDTVLLALYKPSASEIPSAPLMGEFLQQLLYFLQLWARGIPHPGDPLTTFSICFPYFLELERASRRHVADITSADLF